MTRVIAATKNKGKIREIQSILGRLGFEVVSQADANIDVDIEETGKTFEQNALIKARAVAMMCDDVVLADDSGLCVDALDGAPGVYSARYAGEDASDGDRMRKLLDEMKDVCGRKARFVCVVAMIFPDGREVTCEGEVLGEITHEPRGSGGFGYDPIFYSDELKKTFGEATEQEKDGVSHRAHALENLCRRLEGEQ